MRHLIRRILKRYFQWKYRHQDPAVCCCGCMMGEGGSICHHGGCRSQVEYCVTSSVDDICPYKCPLE